MTDMQQPTGQPTGEHDNSGWVILGVILVIAGFFLGAQNLGFIPWQLRETWQWFGRARGGIGVLLVGVALIVWAQSGRRISMPRTSGKLMRSRSDKWVSGVLGGLGTHFGVDPTILRLAFIALVVLFDIGGLVIAYIVMAIVVPLEPHQGAQVPAAPVAYAPPCRRILSHRRPPCRLQPRNHPLLRTQHRPHPTRRYPPSRLNRLRPLLRYPDERVHGSRGKPRPGLAPRRCHRRTCAPLLGADVP